MNRTIRGLEDHETQERKRLHRDVRYPFATPRGCAQDRAGADRRHFHGGAVSPAFFPACATPLLLSWAGALSRPLCLCEQGTAAVSDADRDYTARTWGDPLPGRRGFAKPEGIFFLGKTVNLGIEIVQEESGHIISMDKNFCFKPIVFIEAFLICIGHQDKVSDFIRKAHGAHQWS